MKKVTLSVELYKEGKTFGMYIGDEMGGSGIDVKGDTREEVIAKATPYLADYMEEVK